MSFNTSCGPESHALENTLADKKIQNTQGYIFNNYVILFYGFNIIIYYYFYC